MFSLSEKNKLDQTNSNNDEKGNVLFLILIAVALFAALSYAVTQTSQSGSGDASNETTLISSAQITQYPASVRTSIIRMMISNNVEVTQLEFNPPSDFSNCSSSGTRCVFHPSGGGATYQQAPADVMDDGNPGVWSFNGDFEIVNLGISADDGTAAGNEIIAFLPGIKQSICEKVNSELSFATTTPVITTTIAGADAATPGYLRIMDNATGIPASDILLGTAGAAVSAGTIGDFDGEAFGCFRNTTSGDYVYYHVLVER